jgi:hypothetical protein
MIDNFFHLLEWTEFFFDPTYLVRKKSDQPLTPNFIKLPTKDLILNWFEFFSQQTSR